MKSEAKHALRQRTTEALTGLTLLVGAIGINAGAAQSHDFYDAWCCSGKDCAPITVDATRTQDGKQYYGHHLGSYPVEEGHTRIMPSPDHQTHACIFNGRLRCLYIPGGS